MGLFGTLNLGVSGSRVMVQLLLEAALMIGSPGPSLLAAPEEAVKAADGPARVEALLFMGRPDVALQTLRQAGPQWRETDRVRWEAEALMRVGRPISANAQLDRLAEFPGWREHAESRRQHLARERWRQLLERIGLGLFASIFGLLVLGGSSALLRPRRSGGLALLGVLMSCLVARFLAPRLLGVLLVAGMGAVLLIHAAEATRARTLAGPRIRTLLVALAALGIAGECLAVCARLDTVRLLGRTLGLKTILDAS